jgi:hypothetical protein
MFWHYHKYLLQFHVQLWMSHTQLGPMMHNYMFS